MAPVHLATGLVMGNTPTVNTVPLDNGTSAVGFAAIKRDVNHDGVVDVRDNDGWRCHLGLPFETRLQRHLLNADAAPCSLQP